MIDGEAGVTYRRDETGLGPRARTEMMRRYPLWLLRLGETRYPRREWAQLRRSMGPCRQELAEHGWCPHVGCRWHLYLDVTNDGLSIKHNFPGLEPWEIAESCALDAAGREGATLEAVGAAMNLTRQRVEQLQVKAIGAIAGCGDDIVETLRWLDQHRGGTVYPETFERGETEALRALLPKRSMVTRSGGREAA